MTFYRHFIERDEFDTFVASNSQFFDDYDLPYEPLRIEQSRIWNRACKTRFMPWLNGIQSLYGGSFSLAEVMRAAKEFKPDAVFTVAGSWDWTALAAKKIADTLNVPLIASFNDWYNYGWFPAHNFFHKHIEERFHRFYREADLALCTCEGMKEALGPHTNSHVWYPTGAPMVKELPAYKVQSPTREQPFTVFFGGSLGDWYGKMLEALVTECKESAPEIRFKIFGNLESWSEGFGRWASDSGVFGGRVSFEQLRGQAQKADLLLLPMGFGEECAQVEKTSFKTKFLDYLSFQRPILSWGPEYCSAVKTAREFDSAECVTSEDPKDCALAIRKLAEDTHRRKQLLSNAHSMYKNRFHPDKIHDGLVEKIQLVCHNHRAKT